MTSLFPLFSFFKHVGMDGHKHPLPRHHCSQLHAAGPQYLQPKHRLTSATFHSLPKPQGQLHSWAASWVVPCFPGAIFTITTL